MNLCSVAGNSIEIAICAVCYVMYILTISELHHWPIAFTGQRAADKPRLLKFMSGRSQGPKLHYESSPSDFLTILSVSFPIHVQK
jgi:hypothetical protein